MSRRSEQMRQQNRMKVEEEIRQGYSRMHTLGVNRGAYAICKVILEKANNTDMTLEERLTDIVQFCEKAKNPDDKSENNEDQA